MNYSIKSIIYKLTCFSFENPTSYVLSRYDGLHLMIENDIEKLIKKEMRRIYDKKWRYYHKEYRQRPEVKKHLKEYAKKYNSRPEVKQHRKEYYHQPNIKQREKKRQKEYHKEYWQRPENRKKRREQTALHQENRALTHSNILLMSNPFPVDIEVEYHHLLNDFYNDDSYLWFIIPLPAITHNYVSGATSNRRHWRHNALWIKKLFGIDIKELLEGKVV